MKGGEAGAGVNVIGRAEGEGGIDGFNSFSFSMIRSEEESTRSRIVENLWGNEVVAAFPFINPIIENRSGGEEVAGEVEIGADFISLSMPLQICRAKRG